MSSQIRQVSRSLPVWTFAAADSSNPTTGKFTTDSANPSSTTLINFSNFQKYAPLVNLFNFLATMPYSSVSDFGAHLIFTDALGISSIMAVMQQPTTITGGVSMGVSSSNGGSVSDWRGDYSLSFAPGVSPTSFTGFVSNLPFHVTNGFVDSAPP